MNQRQPGTSLLSLPMSRRRFGSLAGAGTVAAATGLHLSPAMAESVEVTWCSWGNTGEVANLKKFTEDYNASQSDITVKYLPSPNDGYDAKLLTQLTGGTAPDLFYAGDGQVSTIVKNAAAYDLTELLASDKCQSKPDQFAGDLWGPAKTADGKYYGVPVDCNPLVLWYNKKILQDAGITEMPADTYEAGNWNWDTFQSILDAVASKNKRGVVLADWWAPRYSWVTVNGGKLYDGGKFVGNEDAKTVEAFTWIQENLKANKFTFSGSLPKGQGDDAMFMSNQLAFVALGRWGLPLFRENSNLEYDIVPYPTNTGSKIEPAGVAVAYWMMNASTQHVDQAFQFYTYFVSPDGQKGRLSDGGNAVPSITGVEDLVVNDEQPEHAQYFLDARNIGYGPFADEVGTPGLATKVTDLFSKLWLDGGDVKTALDEIAKTANDAIASGSVG